MKRTLIFGLVAATLPALPTPASAAPANVIYGVVRDETLTICGIKIPLGNAAQAAAQVRQACNGKAPNSPPQVQAETEGVVFFDPGSMAVVGTGRQPPPRPGKDPRWTRNALNNLSRQLKNGPPIQLHAIGHQH